MEEERRREGWLLLPVRERAREGGREGREWCGL